jgi:hypothetical protein
VKDRYGVVHEVEPVDVEVATMDERGVCWDAVTVLGVSVISTRPLQ